MRVLYVVPSWFTLRNHLRGHVRFLREAGIEVGIAGDPDPRGVAAALEEGACYYPVPIGQRPALVRDMAALIRLVGIMRGSRFDVVTCTTKKGGVLAGLAARAARVRRVVYVVRGLSSGPVGPREALVHRWVERVASTLADRVIVLSESNRKHFVDRRLSLPRKLRVLGSGSVNGVDTDAFAPTEAWKSGAAALRARLGITPDSPVFGFVGRLSRHKGLEELATAWRRLVSTKPGVSLLLLCPPEVEPKARESVQALARLAGVHFAGFLDSPQIGYAAMDCLVFPSHGEGFSTVLLEAAAMGRPAIASAVVGCVDAVVHEVTGLLVQPRDAAALVRAMTRVLDEPDSARRWGRNGRERCTVLFKPETVWRAYKALYEELMANQPETHQYAPLAR